MTKKISETFDNFSPEKFIDAVEININNFSFNTKKEAKELSEMPGIKRKLFEKAIDSCIYSLAYSAHIDGRNEIAARACRKLNLEKNPMPEVGTLFIRMHPTLQQAAMKLFCMYLDMTESADYKDGIENLKKDCGTRWFCFPMI